MNDPNQTVDEPGRGFGSPVSAASTPTHIGRYRIEKVLGRGGFGLVYLAHDDQLQHLVAIKVPHRKLVDRPEAAEAYLTEARSRAIPASISSCVFRSVACWPGGSDQRRPGRVRVAESASSARPR
jgi:hypothetical protein